MIVITNKYIIAIACFLKGHSFRHTGTHGDIRTGFCTRCNCKMWGSQKLTLEDTSQWTYVKGDLRLREELYCNEALKNNIEIPTLECGLHPIGYKHSRCDKCNYEVNHNEPVEEFRWENDNKEEQVIEYNRYEDGVKKGGVKIAYFTKKQVDHIEAVKEKMRQEGKL